MRRLRIVLLGFAISAVALAASLACGDGDAAPYMLGSARPTATAAEATPEAIGKAIAADYLTMMNELNLLLAPAPAPADLKPRVRELKDRWIAVFVAHGRERETLPESARSDVDTAVVRELAALPTANVTLINATIARTNDLELASDLSSINILMQYSFFELLKRQLPGEAARLGIQ